MNMLSFNAMDQISRIEENVSKANLRIPDTRLLRSPLGLNKMHLIYFRTKLTSQKFYSWAPHKCTSASCMDQVEPNFENWLNFFLRKSTNRQPPPSIMRWRRAARVLHFKFVKKGENITNLQLLDCMTFNWRAEREGGGWLPGSTQQIDAETLLGLRVGWPTLEEGTYSSSTLGRMKKRRLARRPTTRTTTTMTTTGWDYLSN